MILSNARSRDSTVFVVISLLIFSIFSVSISFEPSYALADFNIAAVGDWGCTSNTKNMVNNIIDKDPELVLGLGDYAYRQKAECWLQVVDPIDYKMKIAIGNHDARAIINKTSHPSPTRLQEYIDPNIMSTYMKFYSWSFFFIYL